MFKKLAAVTAAAISMFVIASAHAQTEELIHGEIAALNLNDGIGTLTVREDGTDAIRTFEVTGETDVTVKRDPVGSLVPRPIEAEPSDLSVGDDVLLDVRTEVDGRATLVAYQRVAVEVPARNERASSEPANRTPEPVVVAYQDSSQPSGSDFDYGTLPATATPLPLIALIGACALLIAGGLRLSNRARR